MANLKNITELPVVESADGLNLIVNDNGFAKQISADLVGGAASWNDLTDKPFYTSEKTLLEQRVLDGFVEDGDAGIYFFEAPNIRIDFPNSGIVSIYWDGEIYNCEIRCLYENHAYIEMEIGNSYLIGDTLNDSGEPFYLRYDALKNVADANTFAIATNSSGSSHTIGIIGEDVHTINAKFIPNSIKDKVFIIDSTVLTPDNFNDVTYGDMVKEALLNGQTILLYNGTSYSTVGCFEINDLSAAGYGIQLCLYIITPAYMSGSAPCGIINLQISSV